MLSVLQAARAASPRARAAPLLLDVGANIGMYSLAAASVGAHVVAMEPMPSNAVRLLASARRNNWQSRLHLVTLCASEESGRPCHLGLNPTNQGHLRHQVDEPAAAAAAASATQQQARAAELQRLSGASTQDGVVSSDATGGLLTSASMRVDDVLRPQPRSRPMFVKVDVEGHECRAFRGMRRLLNESGRVVGALVEFDKVKQGCCEELVSAPHGAFAILHERHRLCPYPGKNSRAPPLAMADLCLVDGRGVPKQLNVRWKVCPD